jgi:hypothetical protein
LTHTFWIRMPSMAASPVPHAQMNPILNGAPVGVAALLPAPALLLAPALVDELVVFLLDEQPATSNTTVVTTAIPVRKARFRVRFCRNLTP